MRKNLWWATVPVALTLAGCAAAPPSSPSLSPTTSTSPIPAAATTPPAPPKTTATTPPPPGPPTAADGQNYAACKDGRCEVKVAKSARIPVFELKFATTFTGGTVALTTDFPGGGRTTVRIGESGAATFGRPDGSQIVITFEGMDTAGAAVLDVTTK